MYRTLIFCTQEKNKTFRVGLVNASVALCLPIGTGLSGILYRVLGFSGVYTLALVLCFISVCMAHLFIHDSKVIKFETEKKLNTSKWTQTKDFFDLKHLLDAFKVTFKKAENNRRMKTIALTLLLTGIMGPLQGKSVKKIVFVEMYYDGISSINE